MFFSSSEVMFLVLLLYLIMMSGRKFTLIARYWDGEKNNNTDGLVYIILVQDCVYVSWWSINSRRIAMPWEFFMFREIKNIFYLSQHIYVSTEILYSDKTINSDNCNLWLEYCMRNIATSVNVFDICCISFTVFNFRRSHYELYIYLVLNLNCSIEHSKHNLPNTYVEIVSYRLCLQNLLEISWLTVNIYFHRKCSMASVLSAD